MKNCTLVFLVLLLNLNAFRAEAGDDPCTATPLTISDVCNYISQDNSTATNSSGVTNPACGNYTGGDLWYSFEMPTNGYNVVLDVLAGTLTDAGMALYTGPDCSSLTLQACDDNSGTGNMPALTVDDGCVLGAAPPKYWVRVFGNSGATGTFDICAQAEAPGIPPTAVACGSFQPAGNTCCDALLLTDGLDGYCGSTNGYTDDPAAIPAFCAFIDNNSWVAFIADSSYVELEITSFNCAFMNGIQVAIMYTPDCSSFSVVSNCWNIGTEGTGIVSASGLNPGEIYYVMFDGWAGDLCDYTI